MLLGRLWFRNAKVTHDWGNNVIIVQGNGIVKTISVNKKLEAETIRPQVFICYDSLERLIDEEEDLIFEIEPKLFSIGIINISDEIISLLSIGMSKIKIGEETELEQATSDKKTTKVVPSTTKPKDFYIRLEISLENKVVN
jgi:hypothetical protein